MHSIGALALAAAPLFLVARADLDFDGEDLPAACRSICGPMVQLTQRCDASDLFDNDDARENEYERVEDRLRAQCVCTNDSFDVANIASTCADCIRQNLRTGGGDDDDDYDDELQDINDIIRTCSFATTATWASTASDAANSITVVASAPTAASQLTTTIGAGGNGNGNGNGAPSSTQGQTGPNTTQGQNGPDSTSNNDNNDNNDNNNNNDNNDNDPDSFAAPGAVPLGGLSAYSVLGGFGAFVAGAAVLVL